MRVIHAYQFCGAIFNSGVIDVIWVLVETLTLAVFEEYGTEFPQTLYDHTLPGGLQVCIVSLTFDLYSRSQD